MYEEREYLFPKKDSKKCEKEKKVNGVIAVEATISHSDAQNHIPYKVQGQIKGVDARAIKI